MPRRIQKKGTDISRATNPSNKAQHLIASGFTFAVDADSPVADYFARRGFAVADRQDISQLISDARWIGSRQGAEKLHQEIAPVPVGDRYCPVLADRSGVEVSRL